MDGGGQGTPCRIADGFNVTDCAAIRVQLLREQLVNAGRRYGAALSQPHPSTAPATGEQAGPVSSVHGYVSTLRHELGVAVSDLVDNATAGEVEIARSRAEVESIRDAIRAYEIALGSREGSWTTEWNVLSRNDLEQMQASARDALIALEAICIEPEGSLLHRTLELRVWLRSLTDELKSRSRGPPELKVIRRDISIAEARELHPAIGQADRSASRFTRQMLLQVQMRLHWSPLDAALQVASERLRYSLRADRRATPEALRVKANQGPRPPPELAQLIDGMARDAWVEIAALRARDTRALARARARLSINTRRCQLALGLDDEAVSRWSALPSERLLNLREKYRRWHVALARETLLASYGSEADLDVTEVRSRIEEIDGELMRRHFADRRAVQGPEELCERIASARLGTAYAAFERLAEAALAHEEMVELRMQADRPRGIPDRRLPRLIEEARRRRVHSQSKALEIAALDLQRAIEARKVLQSDEIAERLESTLRELRHLQVQAAHTISSMEDMLLGVEHLLMEMKMADSGTASGSIQTRGQWLRLLQDSAQLASKDTPRYQRQTLDQLEKEWSRDGSLYEVVSKENIVDLLSKAVQAHHDRLEYERFRLIAAGEGWRGKRPFITVTLERQPEYVHELFDFIRLLNDKDTYGSMRSELDSFLSRNPNYLSRVIGKLGEATNARQLVYYSMGGSLEEKTQMYESLRALRERAEERKPEELEPWRRFERMMRKGK